MNKKIKRHQLPVSDHRLCNYSDIGESHHVHEHFDLDRRIEGGMSLGRWLEERDGAPGCVEDAWDALSADRQLVIIMELLGETHARMDTLLDCIKEITCPSK